MLGHIIILMCEAVKLLKRCYDERSYREFLGYKDIEAFLALPKEQIDLNSYVNYRKKMVMFSWCVYILIIHIILHITNSQRFGSENVTVSLQDGNTHEFFAEIRWLLQQSDRGQGTSSRVESHRIWFLGTRPDGVLYGWVLWAAGTLQPCRHVRRACPSFWHRPHRRIVPFIEPKTDPRRHEIHYWASFEVQGTRRRTMDHVFQRSHRKQPGVQGHDQPFLPLRILICTLNLHLYHHHNLSQVILDAF